MNIHQVSVHYVQEQDRILLRISTQEGDEMRLWLTRRLCLALQPTLRQAVQKTDELATRADAAGPARQDPVAQRLVGEFKREVALHNADFKTPYQARAEARLPLGADPLVVSEVRITLQPRAALRIEFQEKLEGSPRRGFQVELTGTLVHGFEHLLDRAVVQSQWWPAAPEGTASKAAGEPERNSAAERPRYLN